MNRYIRYYMNRVWGQDFIWWMQILKECILEHKRSQCNLILQVQECELRSVSRINVNYMPDYDFVVDLMFFTSFVSIKVM